MLIQDYSRLASHHAKIPCQLLLYNKHLQTYLFKEAYDFQVLFLIHVFAFLFFINLSLFYL